jgi:hypothetical protein
MIDQPYTPYPEISQKTVRVYRYGCRAPLEGDAWARLILSRANRYRNDLVSLRDQRIVALKTKDADAATRLKVEARALRAGCGLWYGTYCLVECAARKAKNFRPFDGTGRIGGYLNNGGKLAVRAAMQPHKNLWLEHGERDYYRLHMRIAGTAHEPVMGVWPVKMHRPLPSDGVIVQCWMQLTRIGRHEKWELCLCVEAAEAQRPCGQGVIGLDLGWREREGRGYRVAMTSDGEEILCPPSIRSGLEHYERLTSTRRLAFDAMRPNDQMRSPDKLNRRVRRGEFGELYGWRQQDAHLWDWIANGRARVLARRREHYAAVARSLVSRYAVIVIEKLNLARLATKKEGVQRGNRTDVAPAEFRQVLKAAAAKTACVIAEVPCEWSTAECHECRGIMTVTSKLVLRCEHCAAEHDQDLNAAKNLRRRWEEPEPLANREAAE